MSLWNPYAFSVTGQPVAPAAPPALRVMGGQATAEQLAMAQQAFARFSMHARLSVVPNPTEIGRLKDGSAYRIVTIGKTQIMELHPIATGNIKLKSGIFFKGAPASYAEVENLSEKYTLLYPVRGSLLINYAKSNSGGSSAKWEVVHYEYPFYIPQNRHYRPVIKLNGENGWKYTYTNEMGQFGRTVSVESAIGFVYVAPTAVVGDGDAVRIFTNLGLDGLYRTVTQALSKGAFKYRAPQIAGEAAGTLPASFQMTAETQIYEFPNPQELDILRGFVDRNYSSPNNEYFAMPMVRTKKLESDEILYYYIPGNIFNELIIDQPSYTVYTAFSRNSSTRASVVNTTIYEIPASSDGKASVTSPEVYVFKASSDGYAIDSVDNPVLRREYTPALVRRKNWFNQYYQVHNYTREVLANTHPNIGESGAVNQEIQANYVFEEKEYLGVDNAGAVKYLRTLTTTRFHSSITGSIQVGEYTNTNTVGIGTYKHVKEAEIFGVELTVENNEVSGTYTIAGAGNSGSVAAEYISTSEVNRILYTVPEIELFVYLSEKGTYTHISSIASAGQSITKYPSTTKPIFSGREIVVRRKDVFFRIPVPRNVPMEYDIMSNPLLGLVTPLGNVSIDGYSIEVSNSSFTNSESSPLSPSPGNSYSYNGKLYSDNVAGFIQINGLETYVRATISHCCAPETGGVCLQVSIDDETTQIDRHTFYFLYDSEAGLREMPINMQDAILASMQLPPKASGAPSRPPWNHMVQI